MSRCHYPATPENDASVANPENDLVSIGRDFHPDPAYFDESVRLYASCAGLSISALRRALSYDPETGILSWIRPYGHSGRGGARRGEPVAGASFKIAGSLRSTLGVIYLIVLGRLPVGRVPFRDGQGTNWRWANIRPYEGCENSFTYQNPPTRRAANARARVLRQR